MPGLDTTKLSNTALSLIENLGESFEEVEGATVGVVALVVEINTPEATWIRFRCSDGRRWVQAGLFDRAKYVCNYDSEAE